MNNEIHELKKKILNSVFEFGILAEQKKTFIPGKDFVPVSGKVIDSSDYVGLVESSLDGWFSSGRFTK